MRLTLILIGISLLLLAISPVYSSITKKTFPSFMLILLNYLSPTLEKIGVIIDILRLSIVIIALKKDSNEIKNAKIVK
jgi:hypothetical protein